MTSDALMAAAGISSLSGLSLSVSDNDAGGSFALGPAGLSYTPDLGYRGINQAATLTLTDGSGATVASLEMIVTVVAGQLDDGGHRVLGFNVDDFAVGGAEDDSIQGFGHDDTLDGGDGDDTLIGGTGADVLLGGAGNDLIEATSDDILIDGGDGHDTLILYRPSDYASIGSIQNIEEIVYVSDSSAPRGPIDLSEADDFDGDGRADVVWVDNATGHYSITLGGSYRDSMGLGVSSGREVIATGDFNGDLRSDVVMREADGYTFLASGGLIGDQIGLGNHAGEDVLATGDFDGNGTQDILFRKTANNWSYIVEDGDPTAIRGAGVQANRTVLEVGDFNGDGKDDLLVQDSGNGWVFVAKAANFSDNIGHGGMAGRELLATGDFDGDGGQDLLWRNTGNGWTYSADGDNPNAKIGIGGRNGHTVETVADINGDGKDDLIMRNDANGWAYALLEADAGKVVGLGGRANFDLVGKGDFDGNGQIDLIYQSNDGRAHTFDFVMNGDLSDVRQFFNMNTCEVMASADYNGDGLDEVIMRNKATGLTSVWWGGVPDDLERIGDKSTFDVLGLTVQSGDLL